jgi:hypothetical protein
MSPSTLNYMKKLGASFNLAPCAKVHRVGYGAVTLGEATGSIATLFRGLVAVEA